MCNFSVCEIISIHCELWIAVAIHSSLWMEITLQNTPVLNRWLSEPWYSLFCNYSQLLDYCLRVVIPRSIPRLSMGREVKWFRLQPVRFLHIVECCWTSSEYCSDASLSTDCGNFVTEQSRTLIEWLQWFLSSTISCMCTVYTVHAGCTAHPGPLNSTGVKYGGVWVHLVCGKNLGLANALCIINPLGITNITLAY